MRGIVPSPWSVVRCSGMVVDGNLSRLLKLTCLVLRSPGKSSNRCREVSQVFTGDTRLAVQGDSRGIVAETDRLLLRRLERVDLPFMVELFGSLDVMRYSLTGPLAPPHAADILERFLRSYETQPLAQWAVVEKSTGQLIGLCGFLLRSSGNEGEWELAYRFLPAYWGQGLATEAAIACRDIAFQNPAISQIVVLVEASHIASIRVAEKVGLRLQCETQLQGITVLKFAMQRDSAT